ncbi:hypothetical protein QTA56_06755 [Acinetobacter sp. VNH17]|uniref:Uncharacterized protein n=1 Tax=Acinetobacter thutiue TaxID=2998078 RepID=A0ABT7WMX0_9GAMM|nr:hypothetical protein [Acinetobacter thutiue]MCY6411837.1 hypothetical protein [Acinetobacter thutiue]MDN0013939.1 hypothetical protein [Acinetobacter thutiue]
MLGDIYWDNIPAKVTRIGKKIMKFLSYLKAISMDMGEFSQGE